MNFLSKHKNSFFFLAIIFLIFFNLSFVFNIAGAASNSSNLGGLDETAEGTGHLSLNSINTLEGSISKIIKIVLSLVGVIFLGLLIYGGYIWMIARGNEQQIEKAKGIIINAIIGLIIVVFAYAITVFIGNTLGSQS